MILIITHHCQGVVLFEVTRGMLNSFLTVSQELKLFSAAF